MDPVAICGADDKILEDLGLCAKGDICALRSFCQDSQTSSTPTTSASPENSREERKRKLLSILQSGKKTRLKQNDAEISKEKKLSGATGCQVKGKTRRIQLGWLHFNKKEERYIHVRTTNGGGTRNMDFPAGFTKDKVLHAAIDIFFENGQSKFGFANDMDFDIANFKMEKVNEILKDNNGNENPFTIQGYFQCYKLSKARIYLMSKEKNIEVTNCDNDIEVSWTSVLRTQFTLSWIF